MKLVSDLDGTIRDIHSLIQKRYNFIIKHWSYIHGGKDFWDMVKEYPEVWADALPTKYYNIIKQYEPITFWTVQREENKEATIKWLDKYFTKYKIRFFKDFEHKEKAVYKNNVVLIDDFPNFSNYEKIILIDTNYNKNTKAKIRIKTPEKLQEYLNKCLT